MPVILSDAVWELMGHINLGVEMTDYVFATEMRNLTPFPSLFWCPSPAGLIVLPIDAL